LLKFFLNSDTTSHLRGLADEFSESTNGVRVELNRLEEAGMLNSQYLGNKKMYQANTEHPLYGEVHQIVRKHLGIDKIILTIIDRLGDLDKAYLTGPFANGQDSEIIDVVLIGNLEVAYLNELIIKAEKMISRRIRYIHYTSQDWNDDILTSFGGHPLMIWEKKIELV